MPATPDLLVFLTALFFLEITPGPDMMLVLARGIGQGRKTALLTVARMIFIAGFVQVGLLVLGVASSANGSIAGPTFLSGKRASPASSWSGSESGCW